jgi:CBS domain-containing protein
MRAKDVMSTDVATVGRDASLLEAMTMLVNANVSALPVTDSGGVLVGMLSEYDLIRQVLRGPDPSVGLQSSREEDGTVAEAWSRPVHTVMTTPVVTLAEDSPLEAVITLILESRYRLIPIVRGRAMVGIVGRSDLVKALLSRTPTGVATAGDGATVADDDNLRRAVTAAVNKLGVGVGGGFDVVSRGGVVHLWGEVADEADHQACRGAALKVAGVRDVHNHMQIISPDRRMARRSW